MSLIQLDKLPKFSKNLSINIWVDFVELYCLTTTDKEISLSDIFSNYRQENMLQDEILEEETDGDESFSERIEDIRSEFLEIFRYIKSRKMFLSDFYPFESVSDTTIKLSDLDNKKYFYIYFLLSSNTSYFIDKKISPLFTTSFERISLDIIKTIYPNFTSHLFGTANQRGDYFYGGTLIQKLAKLAQCLGTNITQNVIDNPGNQSGGGDKGLDIVSFFHHDSQISPFIPFCFGQCTCSYDSWKIKQESIKYSSWNRRFTDLPAYHEYVFVPFSLRETNGNWEKYELEEMSTIVIDRFRIINIFNYNNMDCSTVLNDRIKMHITNLLEGSNENRN